MSSRKSYRQFCGVARALDVVGERWTLLIVRDLLLGPRRYGDLLASLPGLTTNLLAKRLRELEGDELVERTRLPPPASTFAYALTESGRALEPIVLALGAFGARSMKEPKARERSDVRWLIVSLKRRYRPRTEKLVAEIRCAERTFALVLRPDRLEAHEGSATSPDIALTAELPALRALFFGVTTAKKLRKSRELTIEGSAHATAELLAGFGLEGA